MSTDDYRHRVLLQSPVGAPVPDGDGGSTQAYADLVPASWKCSVEPATARSLERLTGGTTISMASHIVRGRYRGDVTTQSRVIFNGRRLNVTSVGNPDERGITLELACVEVVA